MTNYHNLDFMGLCETWLKPNYFISLNEALPPNDTSLQESHESRRGGGIAAIHDSRLSMLNQLTPQFYVLSGTCASYNQFL